MQIEPTDLRARIEQVRLDFDTRLAEVLLGRPGLSQDEIGKQFRVSRNVIRRVMKEFNINARKRGPKPAQRVLNA
jgi:transposase